MRFKKFNYISNFNYDKGWDKYAEDYANLLIPGTVYYLTKELAHQIVRKFISGNNIHVLDINCGTGNDFPFFFEKGWKISASDGSAGMLNKAYEKYSEEITEGKLQLYYGTLEQLDADSFDDQKYDLIYSITGGFSYVDDEMVIKVMNELSNYLKPSGIMVIGHLTSFCLSETLYNVFRFRWKNAFLRLNKTVDVNIKNQPLKMKLRSYNDLKKMKPSGVELIKTYPLLAFTPPFQTGFRPNAWVLRFLKKIEKNSLNKSSLCHISDQVMMVYKKK